MPLYAHGRGEGGMCGGGGWGAGVDLFQSGDPGESELLGLVELWQSMAHCVTDCHWSVDVPLAASLNTTGPCWRKADQGCQVLLNGDGLLEGG